MKKLKEIKEHIYAYLKNSNIVTSETYQSIDDNFLTTDFSIKVANS